MPAIDLLDTFTETLCVRYDNVTLGFNFVGSKLGTCGALIVNPIRNLHRWLVKPFLHLVQSPIGLFTLGKCLPEVDLLFVEKLRIATYHLGPMGKDEDNTKLC